MTRLATSVFNITNRLVHEYGLGELLFNVEEINGASIIDSRLVSPVDSGDKYVGAYIRTYHSSTNQHETRQVQSYDPITGQLTVFPPLSMQYTTGENIQIWKYYNPNNIIYDIELALSSIPLKKIIPLTIFDAQTFKLQIDRKKPIIIAVELVSDDPELYGNIECLFNATTTINEVAIAGTLNMQSAVVTFEINRDYSGLADISFINSTNGVIVGVHVIKPYTNTIYLTNISRIIPADIHGIYAIDDYFDRKVADNIYERNDIDWSRRRRINGWYMPDERTLILPTPTSVPIYAYVQQGHSEMINYSYVTKYNLPYEVNEALLLHKTAEIIFSRILTQASITGIDMNWAEAQLLKSRQAVAEELLKENMRVRANTPKDQGIAYILGDTYLGSVW